MIYVSCLCLFFSCIAFSMQLLLEWKIRNTYSVHTIACIYASYLRVYVSMLTRMAAQKRVHLPSNNMRQFRINEVEEEAGVEEFISTNECNTLINKLKMWKNFQIKNEHLKKRPVSILKKELLSWSAVKCHRLNICFVSKRTNE